MGVIIVAVSVVVSVLVIIFLIAKFQREQTIQMIKQQYGEKPEFDSRFFEMANARYLFDRFTPVQAIDETTFQDLDMEALFHRMNVTQSSLGESMLYYRLRDMREHNRDDFELKVTAMEDEATRLKVLLPLNRIGKPREKMMQAYFDGYEPIDHNFNIILILARAFAIGSILMLFIDVTAGILGVTFSFIAMFALNEKVNDQIKANITSAAYFTDVIKCGHKITKFEHESFEEEMERLRLSLKPFNGVSAMLSFAMPTNQSDIMGVSFFTTILSTYFLITPLAYSRVIKIYNSNQDAMREAIEIMGMLEVYVATASYRESLQSYSLPIISDRSAPKFKNIVHPLIEEAAIANTAEMDQRCLITGSNASGKSTFVRALALNTILGQNFNTCTADSFELRHAQVITSMAMRDNIESGDSYFVTETKSIKRILDAVKHETFTLVFIDEILKGTNTIERIAASASVLSALAHESCFVAAATHDIELTEMLGTIYTNYHFRETITNYGIEFDYQLRQGPSNTTNAIRLLEHYGYDPELVAVADELASQFRTTRSWSPINVNDK